MTTRVHSRLQDGLLTLRRGVALRAHAPVSLSVMLGIDARAFRVAWTIFLFGLLLATIYTIRETLMVVAVAILFAYLLEPVVRRVERVTPKRRNVALAVVYIALVGALVAGAVLIGTRIAEQATSLLNRFPTLVQQDSWINIPVPNWLLPLREKIVFLLKGELNEAMGNVVPLLQKAGGQLISGLSHALFIILVPIFSFFLLKDGKAIRTALIGAVDEGRGRRLLERILDDIHNLLSHYIRALVLLAVASFAGWAIFLPFIGAPYSLLLASIAGMFEFIPVIGPLSAGIVILIVCAMTGFKHFLIIIIFWIVFRLVQDYFIAPQLMSSGVELHPLLVLFGVLAGEQVGGISGMFFSVPVIAILRAIYSRARDAYTQRAFT